MTEDPKKAAYRAKQRERETQRRAALGMPAYEPPQPTRRRTRPAAARPAWGSQEWAETYSDDLGESPDV